MASRVVRGASRRTQITLTRAQHARVTRLAAERGTSIAGVIRDALDRYPELSAGEEADLFAIVGIGASGDPDASQRHDSVIYGHP